MARAKNLISAALTAENITKTKTHIGEIETELPFLIALPAEEKRRMNAMGQKSVEYVNLALTGAENFPQYLLPSFKKDEFKKDVTLIRDLQGIRTSVASLLEKLDDTIYGASVDAMQAANEVYDYLKTAGEKDAAVKALVSEMRKRYDHKDKKPAEPNKPADPKQPADPKKPDTPKKPGTGGDPDIHLPEE